MTFPISFYYSNSLKYFIFYTLSGLYGYILRHYYKEKMSTIFQLLLMYTGESCAFFFYQYEKYQFKNQSKNAQEENLIYQAITKKKLYFLLLWCSIVDLIGTADYSKFIFNHDMKKIDSNYWERGLTCLFIYIHEYYYLKIQTYIHQKLGIEINLSCLFLTCFIKINNSKSKLSSLLYKIVICTQFTYIQSFMYIIEKKLNYEYYININFICFIEGFFGIIILLFFILFIILFNPFYYHNNIINEIIPRFEYNNIIFWSILIPIYIFSLTIVNISRLKIIEKNRPSFIIIGKAFRHLFFSIADVFIKEDGNNDIYAILNMFVSLLGSLILGEMIILNFFNLNKYTQNLTSIRGELETRNSVNIELEINNNILFID